MWKMTPISVRLNLKNFILISCAVFELLRKVSQGRRALRREIVGKNGFIVDSRSTDSAL